jgi:hypothetical protein
MYFFYYKESKHADIFIVKEQKIILVILTRSYAKLQAQKIPTAL